MLGPRQVLTRAIVKARFVLIPLKGLFICGRRQRPIEYLPPMAGGGGPHNKSPRRGSGLLGGGWGVVFADWNAPALGGILDQQGVGNVGNSTTYQP